MENASKQDLPNQTEIDLTRSERPLFEANYTKLGGKLQFLKWVECKDGIGCYEADWDAISQAKIIDSEFDEQIIEHAEHITGCLHSWVECAKSKAIPDGWVLAPKEPVEKQKQAATLVSLSGGNAIEAYKAMLHILEEPVA